jgi:hypothetical protein
MKPSYLNLLTAAILFFYCFSLQAQLPGFINRQATSAGGRAVLDPNSDGYTSVTTAGFGNDDIANSEIPFKGIKAYSIESFGDLSRGPNHGFSDFVFDANGDGVYHFFSVAQNVLFRMRMGSIIPGSKGFSILMDTDGKFGASGPNADPNYIASTTGTNGNPGFEIEIVLETNFRIAIYNIDGTSSAVLVKQYLNWQEMSQISIASTNDNGDPDFLIDFYIPFADLQAAPFNLTAASPIRMCAATVMSPQSATGGPRSDIYGTAGNSYEDFINGQPPCPIFNNPSTCITTMCTSAPLVNSPINTGTVTISGTWTKSDLTGALSTATITVYKNGTSIGTISNVSSGNTWSLNSITLINGDIITAKAQAAGESMCLTSNAVAASTCNSSTIPPAPVLDCYSGSKGLSGSNLSTGWTVHVNNMTRGVFDNSVTNATGLFGANSGSSPSINWVFSGGCSSGAPLNSGSYKIYYVNNATGCTSSPAYFCAAGNGGSALAGTLAVPTITAPVNNIFTTATKTISGTTDAGAAVSLYINGVNVQTVTATGGNFSFTNLNLLNGQQLYLLNELNTGTISTSKCANQTAVFTVTCFTETPLINADNNNQLTASAPITGTSTEVAGTLIRIYTSINTLVATTTVQANGTWSTGNAGTLPSTYNAVAGTAYYANAQNGSCGVSGNSASYSAAAPTSVARCGTITGPVAPGAASISGSLTGSFTTTTVNLYLDGQAIGTINTNGTSWGPIPVNSTTSNTLYSNGVLSIGVQETGKQEVLCPNTVTISCTPTPTAPAYSPAVSNINVNQTVTYTISNATTGTFYAIADQSTGMSLASGKWATANGSLTITTDPFTTAGTYNLVLKSTSLSGVAICSALSSAAVVNVSLVTLPLDLLQFNATKQEASVVLNWVTANEYQLNRFEVERSANGLTFNEIGSVRATGSIGGNQNYSFTDLNPMTAAVNYYRLKMIDNDGKFRFSNVVAVRSDQSEKFIINKIKPNPFINEINIQVVMQQNNKLRFDLVDIMGRIVLTKEYKVSAGENNIILNTTAPQLQPGLYILKISTVDAVMQQKLLKLNR